MHARDEGYTEDEMSPILQAFPNQDAWVQCVSLKDKEELAYKLLSSLPISILARVQRKIAPLLQMDIIGLLPNELSLYVLSFLSYQDLLICSLVSQRWHVLANEPLLWKHLCTIEGWQWRESQRLRLSDTPLPRDFDDEGVGEDEEDFTGDSGFVSMSAESSGSTHSRRGKDPFMVRRRPFSVLIPTSSQYASFSSISHPTPVTGSQTSLSKPDYKLLHQTHILLHNRLLHSSYHLTSLQSHLTPNSHIATVYCLQLHTFSESLGAPARQVLFSGSRDQTVRQWDLSTGKVERVFSGVHDGSVLSICIRKNYLISGGSDRKVIVWDLHTGDVVRIIEDHSDSVLCVRADDTRLVTCSKDRTVRTYLFPTLTQHLTLASHRAAVNAVSISGIQIVSASGDRSIRIWNAETGALLHCFEQHHSRGIASVDFAPPYILSGSSDKHLRLVNILTAHGWSTSPHVDSYAQVPPASAVCQTCGSSSGPDPDAVKRASIMPAQAHRGLVRTVAFGDKYVVSGSYDQTIKVWDRATGNLIADLKGGHNGKIFCVATDCTKVVSCGEDMRICIWDFAYGIPTSFIKL
ncbi:WD40 repeat-like protein [Hysterangium stoloniferum]|nr:WD40 repeat-like protein [Hysterangium stoloniferum]